MEVLFHFVFEIFKIVILASVYTTIIVFIIDRIGRNKSSSLVNYVLKKRIAVWFIAGFFISIMLFAYSSSYWGDHGLGDNARIPVGHGKAVQQIDGTWTYIMPIGYEDETLSIDDYAIANNILLAKISGDQALEKNAEFAAWNLKSNQVRFLKNYTEVEDFKLNNNIVEQLKFFSFREHYNNYWSGWRFWLLA